MSDFNPITIFFVLYEGMGSWLWGLLGLAFVLLAAVVFGIVRLRRADRPVLRPLLVAGIAGLIAAAVLMFFVPMWTLADAAALSAPIDYAVAFLFALMPGAVVAALTFLLAACLPLSATPEPRLRATS